MSLIARQTEGLSGFDPRSLPGLEVWYDAQYPSGFGATPPADGTAVSQWNDLSGKGRHAVQATAIKQPFYRTALASGSLLNIVPNPRLANSVSGWNSNNGAVYPVTRDTTVHHNYTASAKSVYNASVLTSTFASQYLGSTVPGTYAINVVPGTAYHVKIWGMASRSCKIGAVAECRDNSGTVVPYGASAQPASNIYGTTMTPTTGRDSIAAPVNMNASTWTSIELVTAPTPVGATTMLVSATMSTQDGSNASSGDTGWFTELLVEPWPNNGQYIDGDFGGGMGWAGTAHASTTVSTTAWPSRVQYDGLDDALASATLSGVSSTSPVTLYTVSTDSGINASANSSHVLFGPGTSSPPRALLLASPTGRSVFGNTTTASASASTGKAYVSVGTFDGSSLGTIANNGATAVSNAVGSAGFGSIMVIGSYSSSSVNAMFGSISAALAYSVKHDAATQRRVENWLGARYGIALNRP